MNKKDLIKWGSKTAKGGFRNEDDIVRKFNDWGKDEDAQKWLAIMGYPVKEIEKVEFFALDTIKKMIASGEKFHPSFVLLYNKGVYARI